MEFVVVAVSSFLILFIILMYVTLKTNQKYSDELLLAIRRVTEPPKSISEMQLFCEQHGYKYNIDGSSFIFLFSTIPFRMSLKYDTNNGNLLKEVSIGGSTEKYISFLLWKDLKDESLSTSVAPMMDYPVTREATELAIFLNKKYGIENLQELMNRHR